MLLYIKNKAFPDQTFVEIVSPIDSVARVRALILHRLYEIGHSHHQFRLKYKKTFLRDSYTLEEYQILNNAVIDVIPLDNIKEWKKNMMLHQPSKDVSQINNCVQEKLLLEVECLDKREWYLTLYKVVLMMQAIFVVLAFFTNYWYFSFVYFFILLTSLYFYPSFSRIGGWVGESSYRRFDYIRAMVFLFMSGLIISSVLFGLSISKLKSSNYPTTTCEENSASCFIDAQTDVQIANCKNKQQRCYETSVFTGVYFGLVMLLMGFTGGFSFLLLRNFKFSAGDYIEKLLTKSRDLKSLLSLAKNGSLFEQRSSTFEIATMAASGDEHKLEIVNEKGLPVLISVALSKDETTQEYATEAIAECLTIPSIQDEFVEYGGANSLTALLRAKNSRTVHQAITALNYVVSDSDKNKMSVVDHESLQDILFACKRTDGKDRETLASILLELSYYEKTRSVLASSSISMECAYELLYNSIDSAQFKKTVEHVLQTMELLAIESPSVLLTQENLPTQLLEVALKIQDSNVWILAAKLLVCLSQNIEGREKLVSSKAFVDCLYNYAQTNDLNLLRSLAKMSLNVTTSFRLREKLINDGMLDLLNLLQSTTNDKEVWNLVEKAIKCLQSGKASTEDVPLKKKPLQLSTTSLSNSTASSSDDIVIG